jgi:murein DD-endopeptidase MepM/ murein hydrolase activator NlpD
MLTDSSPGNDTADDEKPQAEPDAEVAFVMRDLPAMMPTLKIALQTPNDDVMARVRQAADWSEKTGEHRPASNVTGIKLAYANEAAPDPYAGFEARIVPENITLLPKTANQTTGGTASNERVIIAKKGDNVASVLRDLGATPDEIKAITAALGSRGRDTGIKEGQKLRILLAASGAETTHQQPIRVMVANDTAIEAVAALADTGKYVAVDPQAIETNVASSSEDNNDDNNDTSGVRLYQSIYETALRNQIPRPIIDDLIRIYSYDVDYQRKVQPGDTFEVLYAGEDETPSVDSRNEVLFASLTVGDETKKFYRFQSPDDGVVDYYDDAGKSAKKFLVRKPVAEGIMRSPFGFRSHPILGYTKMHTGVDWAAPTGTPIYASGNGTVEKAGWESGYGKFVLLRHANGYETAYGHMSAFARNMEEGTRVRQGQVIGFVGSTGLSTGSHVHYEIRVNGRFVDPMRIKLPRGRELEGTMLASFEQERDRLDGIMARKPARVASTGPNGR